jgi:hypothetical protein
MTAKGMEIIDETEIFTEALFASVMLGALTVNQLKRQLEDGLAYIEARGADNVAEELLVAVAALQRVNEGITSGSLMATDLRRASLCSAITRRPAAADCACGKIILMPPSTIQSTWLCRMSQRHSDKCHSKS